MSETMIKAIPTLLFAAAGLLAAPSFAQEKGTEERRRDAAPAKPANVAPAVRSEKPNSEYRLQRMEERKAAISREEVPDLTEEQKARVREITARYKQATRELPEGMTVEEMRDPERLRALEEQRDAELREVFTPEQYEHYKQKQAENERRRQEQRDRVRSEQLNKVQPARAR